MKVKTFQFNVLSSCVDNDMHMKKQNMHDEWESLYTPEKIDKTINEFCKDKHVIDILVNEIYRSNTKDNGTNKVMLQYTIKYTDNEFDMKPLNG